MFTPLLEVCGSEEASARVRVQGSCCPQRCFSNQQFQVGHIQAIPQMNVIVFFYKCASIRFLFTQQIVSNMGEKLGTIWKKWPGFNVERNMDHEHFGLEGENDF